MNSIFLREYMHVCWFLIGLTLSVGLCRPAPADDSERIGLLIQTMLRTESESTRKVLLNGVLKGLEGRRNVSAPKQWKELNQQLQKSEDPQLREMASRLSQIFGDQAALQQAMQTLLDKSAKLTARQAALTSLVSQRYDQLGGQLESLLTEDSLRISAIRAYGSTGSPDAPEILLDRYAQFEPEEQRAVIETLATRREFARALVSAIDEEIVGREVIPSYLARSLRDLLGKEFTEVYGEIQELNQNTQEMITTYRKMITLEALEEASASRGRVVFNKTCAACHLMYGEGGKIGPNLTGSNRANLDYLLLNSLDPSADVPESYRMVIVQTVDGRVLNGVIAEENNQRIILKTVDQPELIVSKADIDARKVSELSMMPAGQLQKLKDQELFDLIKYMQTTEQVELPE